MTGNKIIVTDPKGTVLEETGKIPYNIKVFNTINTKHYNPFVYIKSGQDIDTFLNAVEVVYKRRVKQKTKQNSKGAR